MLKDKTHIVDLHVGARLRKRRLRLGMSQEQLGEAVDLTFQQIQKYEKGYNRISCSKLYEFANILNTSVEYFFSGLSDKPLHQEEVKYTFDEQNYNYSSLDSAKNEYQDEGSDAELNDLLMYFKRIKSQEAKDQIITLVKLLAATPNGKLPS